MLRYPRDGASSVKSSRSSSLYDYPGQCRMIDCSVANQCLVGNENPLTVSIGFNDAQGRSFKAGYRSVIFSSAGFNTVQ